MGDCAVPSCFGDGKINNKNTRKKDEVASYATPTRRNPPPLLPCVSQDMKCDACIGVATMYAANLLSAETKTGKERKRLTETSYLNIMELTCEKTPWVETFGVTPGYGGINYLTGPGLEEPPLDDNTEQVNAVVTRRGGDDTTKYITQNHNQPFWCALCTLRLL